MLLTVTRLYFGAQEDGERSVCLTSAFVFLLLALLVQVVPDTTLELGLEPGTFQGGSVSLTPISGSTELGSARVTPASVLWLCGF